MVNVLQNFDRIADVIEKDRADEMMETASANVPKDYVCIVYPSCSLARHRLAPQPSRWASAIISTSIRPAIIHLGLRRSQ